jgi:hypothetical protein
VQLAGVGEAFDRRHMRAVAGRGERRARLDRLAIDMDHARPALRRVAADMGACEVEVVAQELDKQRARIDVRTDRLSVHGHGYRHHKVIPPKQSSLSVALARSRRTRLNFREGFPAPGALGVSTPSFSRRAGRAGIVAAKLDYRGSRGKPPPLNSRGDDAAGLSHFRRRRPDGSDLNVAAFEEAC